MFNGIFRIPEPQNEPVYSYAPGTSERSNLKAKLKEMLANPIDVPMIIGGKEVRNGDLVNLRCPHDHSARLGQYHQANADYALQAIAAANDAKKEWSEMPWDARAIILLKAAELLSTKYRTVLNA
ncbi:MAG: aldehyde dehydrogenase family protein, partial [Candidatus Hinthialibacter sp.]